jgi:hypothetical protein
MIHVFRRAIATSILRRFARGCVCHTYGSYFVWTCTVLIPVFCCGRAIAGPASCALPASLPVNSGKVMPAHCGPDSLWFVLMRLGINENLLDVRASFVPAESESRSSLLDLQQVAQRYSLHAYPLEMNRASIQRLGELMRTRGESQVGAIVHVPIAWGHFAPLVWMDNRRVQLLDVSYMRPLYVVLKDLPDTERISVLVLSEVLPMHGTDERRAEAMRPGLLHP